MKKLSKIILSMVCAAACALPVFATACGGHEDSGKDPEHTHVDYASQVKLDLDSNTKKQEVTVRLFVDGDTTHFDTVKNSTIKGCNNAEDFNTEDAPTKGYAKARYLAVNTPESTGQIEEWGKAASKFTRSKLENATSWIIESNDENWNIDSTGGRYLLWVWYLPKGETEYRNLNIEILQAGLAFASGISDTRYAAKAQAAIDQAEEEKLYVFSGEKDPDYWYGGPINVDLQELRFNAAQYEGKKIQVIGNVVANFNNSAYIEDTFYNIEGYETEGIRIGMPVYYSYTKGKVLEILATGNRVSVVGVVQYYSTGGYYQITDIKPYDRYKPVENCEIVEEVGLDNAYTELDPAKFNSTTADISVEVNKKNEEGETVVETVSKTFRDAILGTSVTVKDLYVYRATKTQNEESSSYGAMTLYCRRGTDGPEIAIRTEVFKDSNGNLIEPSAYLNKTITVKGVVEYFSIAGSYQIKCHRADYITIVD